MTPEDRDLLETTARSLVTLEADISERIEAMDIVLGELLRSKEKSEFALARLRIRADLLRMKGTPSAYLETFLRRIEGS